ncbi:hypothetical protein [Ascidiimonas sp. W6]|uniref:hypothetical protein n=1 Tax=Ascidiimonas meishanensis TaxID=3128903 RepID=UPI0030EDA840
MKIRTSEDIEKLDLKIKGELGLDVKKYRNEEVAENLVDLIIFPKYIIQWVIKPILISLLIYASGFFFLDLVDVDYFVYGIIGLIIFLTVGLIAGLLFLTGRMKSDMLKIMNYSLDIMKSAVEDSTELNHKMTHENEKEVLDLLFKGIIYIVTIPMIVKATANKIPIIGGLIGSMAKEFLIFAADKIKFDENKINLDLAKNEQGLNKLQAYQNSIASVSSKFEKIMNFIFGLARFTLKIGFGITLLILILFVYLVN